MEHPLMFLYELFKLVGLGEWAHHNTNVIYSWLVMLILLVLAKIATKSIQMIPSGAQNVFEVVISGWEDFMVDVMGEHGRPYFPLIFTLFIYILFMNWMGLVPGMFSPSANINTPLSMALIVFITTHIVGIKEHGFHYVKHFMGPVAALAPLMIIIEVISHFARVLSLTFRLFGNILGEDLVVTILVFLAGMYLAPLPMMALGVFTCFLQAFIFSLLTMLYIAAALEEAH